MPYLKKKETVSDFTYFSFWSFWVHMVKWKCALFFNHQLECKLLKVIYFNVYQMHGSATHTQWTPIPEKALLRINSSYFCKD